MGWWKNLDIYQFGLNPNAIKILEENRDKNNWCYLCVNPNPKAIEILKENQYKIRWSELSKNLNEIKLLEKNRDKIHYLNLSANPNAIELLKDNLNDINWISFSVNPDIFQLDYKAMKIANEGIYEELIEEVMKPSRVFKNPDYDYIEELFGD